MQILWRIYCQYVVNKIGKLIIGQIHCETKLIVLLVYFIFNILWNSLINFAHVEMN
jgi:hypothetical protein